MHSLLSKLLCLEEGQFFYTFSNTDGKIWIMPAQNMQVAMNLYQPSSIKGKFLKFFFPYLHQVAFVRRVIKAERKACELQKELRDLLCAIFQTSDLEFAVFCGTPCIHQKITIQLSNGKRILGYCKVTNNKEITKLFYKEEEILKRLEKQGVKNIPKCLYCGKITEDKTLFVQSTTKTLKSQIPHEWNTLHKTFLEELHKRTLHKIPFEKSDYYQTLQNLQSHLDWLPQFMNRELIERTINRIINIHYEKQVEFSAYHADFTPWNMFVEKRKLFVFDWEYTQLTYPPQLDRYHFFTQTAIFKKHWNALEIIHYMESGKGHWIDRKRYVLYLLDVIARFTIREEGNVTEDIAKSFSLWMDLLEYLQK